MVSLGQRRDRTMDQKSSSCASYRSGYLGLSLRCVGAHSIPGCFCTNSTEAEGSMEEIQSTSSSAKTGKQSMGRRLQKTKTWAQMRIVS